MDDIQILMISKEGIRSLTMKLLNWKSLNSFNTSLFVVLLLLGLIFIQLNPYCSFSQHSALVRVHE